MVAILHAATELVDQFAHGDARGRQFDPRIFHPARYRETSQAFAATPALRREPGRALFDNFANPIERLDILFERWTTEQPDLRNIRRTMTRQSALALD